MDPITVAARRFLRDLTRFWKRHPERAARLVAGEGADKHVRDALRLAEYDVSSRRPVFMEDGPFEGAATYWQKVIDRVVREHALVREGAAKEGVLLPALDLPARAAEGTFEERAHAVFCAAAERLVPRLEGAVVALVPSSVAAEREWRTSIERLVRLPRPSSLRLVVLDTKGGALAGVLGDEAIELSVDLDELFDYLEQQAKRRSQGPATPEQPPLPPEVRAALEQSGRTIPRTETAVALHTLFLKGARAAAKKDFKGAAAEYRSARDLCHEEGFAAEEAGAAFTLAGAYLAAGVIPMAQATYGQAALLAAEQKIWPLACQAKLGEASAGWMDRDHGRAARAYSEAAALAERGEIPLLRVEALRMEGHSHRLRGAEADAIRAWRKAVDVGLSAEESVRRTNSFREAAESLAGLLDQRSLSSQAAELRALVAVEPGKKG